MAWRAIPGPLSKLKRRLDSLEAAQGAPRDPRRDSRGQSSTRLSDSYSHTSAGTALSGSQFRKLSVITVVISGLRLRALFSLHPWRFLCFPHLKVQICGGFCEPRHTVG